MEQLLPQDPHRIGPYRLLARLGSGGMGRVYLARSDRGRTVAVKLVHRELALREEFRIRFRREVAAARRIGSEWTAPVLDADTEAETPWLATGYIAGPALRQVVSHDFGPLPSRSVRILAAGLAYAVQDIHSAGLIHRDLKPSNVLVTLDGPRVIDFGIARALAQPDQPHQPHLPHESDHSDPSDQLGGGLTRTGQLVGSPGFMAPEQIRGERVSPACDVFCLGTVLAYAATGRLPFGDAQEAGGLAALLLRITGAEPVLDGVPGELRDLVRDCLHKNPAARPTPAQILARVGAGDTVADGRALEPWLPSPLVAQLGRHAVRLLDHEESIPAGPPGPATPARSTAGTTGAATTDAGTTGAGTTGAGTTDAGTTDAGTTGAGPGSRGASAAAPTGRAPAPTQSPGPVAPTPPSPAPAAPTHPTSDATPPQGSGLAPTPSARPGSATTPPQEPGSAASRSPETGFAPDAPPGPGPGAAQPTGPGHRSASADQARPGAEPPQPTQPGFGPEEPTRVAGLPVYGPVPVNPGRPTYPPHPTYLGLPPVEEPPRPHRPRAASTAFLLAVAAVVAVAAGGTVYAVVRGGHPGEPAPGQRTRTAPAPSPTAGGTGATGSAPSSPGSRSSADSGSGSDSGSGTGTGSSSPGGADSLPPAYAGTWRTTATTQTWHLTLTPGSVGDPVMRLSVQDPSYSCTWTATLQHGGDTVELSASTLQSGGPPHCQPGPWSRLRLLPDGSLQRQLMEGDRPPLTYQRG
ncbi:serine/threonine-protein kinase [Streptomyces antimicrobicus]|uniref:Protein kinase n=1 Tax=Streptomyces antimicrobicus TaxID=2883108 RepID=A0ABS8B2D0_9ACTN|nr:serine/threonine-protein kinase [Streptomyces antimicrobicus]MCB5178746.1 protein kinase [Streptomyces antimicrobicus]